MTAHKCDPSTVNGGGLLSLNRSHRFALATIDHNGKETAAVIAEVDTCPKCWLWLTCGLGGLLTALGQLPDFRMGLELQRAAVEADMAAGKIDGPPDGYQLG